MHEYVMAETENVFIQDAFTNSNAQVVCKQLGCKGGTQRQRFGGGVGPIWMDNVYCTGKEEVLSSCRFNGWGRHNCGHHEVTPRVIRLHEILCQWTMDLSSEFVYVRAHTQI